jgi:tetratricopeptide (TPR) repeat protein
MRMDSEIWSEGLDEVCSNFQLDISCLLDNELDQGAAGRAMVHMEACSCCRSFFEDTRLQVQMNRDMSDPSRLFARVAMLTGGHAQGGASAAESIDLVHRLATIFYQLGKAYVLASIDAGYRERVFEAVVPLEAGQTRGRGFVDGVLMNGKGEIGGLDWQRARAMLNGRLERIESPLEKGRRLLEEAIATDPSHEEARLYLAFLHGHEGKRIRAAEEYREIFNTAISDTNRGHAAIQLGRLHSAEKDYRKAIACWRWVTMSGLAEGDERFFVARFNLGMVYALMRNQGRALTYFRELLDRHPGRVGEVAALFSRSPRLREAIDAQAGFGEALVRTCPELFSCTPNTTGSAEADLESTGNPSTGENGTGPIGAPEEEA